MILLIALGSMEIGCQPRSKETTQAPLVEAGTPTRQNIPVFKEWVGHLNGNINVSILPQISGYLVSQTYKNGSTVKEGEELFRIDDRIYRDKVQQAEGELAKAKASWQENDYNRNLYAPLAKEDAISQQKYQDSVLSAEAAKASLIATEAALSLARQQLSYTIVTSPIDGTAGIASAQIGDLVSPSSSSLTIVSATNPIRIDFSVSQNDWAEQEAHHTSPSLGLALGNSLDVYLPDGQRLPHQASIVAIDRAFSTSTGSIRIQAHLCNNQGKLKPGMFVKVRSQIGFLPGALTVPVQAILSTQGKDFVIALDDSDRPHLIPVKTGTIYENMQVIEELIPDTVNENTRLVMKGIQQAALVAGSHHDIKLRIEPNADQDE